MAVPTGRTAARRWLVGLVAITAVACAGGGPTSAGSEAAAAPTVAVADSDLGSIRVDAEGNTLYLFNNDTGSESTCYQDCASNWPALEADGEPTAGEGIDQELLATTERTDDTTQVTYNDHPLYYFAGDESPGDTNGQNVGDVWFVVSPEGGALTAAAKTAVDGDY